MRTVRKRGSAGSAARTTEAKQMLTELAKEDVLLKLPLVDAALSGAILAIDPSNRELRSHAAKAWEVLESKLVHHLTVEDSSMLKFAESLPGVAPKVVERTHRQHDLIRELARSVATTSFESADDVAVKKAARDLCALAVHIDDMIAGEERDLFPILQRTLFAREGAERAS